MADIFPLPLTWESPDIETPIIRESQLGRSGVRLTERIGTGSLEGQRQCVFTFAGDDIYSIVEGFLKDRKPFHLVSDVSVIPPTDDRVWVLDGGYSFSFPGPSIYQVSFSVLRVFQSGELSSLSLDAPIELFEISDFNLRSPAETIYIANYVGVNFEGVTYAAIGCEGSEFDIVGKGSPPQPKLTISNVGRFASDLLYRLTNLAGYRLEGATVTRRLTEKRFLDGQSEANAAVREQQPQVYEVEQLESESSTYVALKLSLPGLEGETLPSRPALRSCTWIYRSADCGYASDKMFDVNNQPTLDTSKDVCSKTLTSCAIRFGENVDLNFGGIPGLQTYG